MRNPRASNSRSCLPLFTSNFTPEEEQRRLHPGGTDLLAEASPALGAIDDEGSVSYAVTDAAFAGLILPSAGRFGLFGLIRMQLSTAGRPPVGLELPPGHARPAGNQ